MHFDHFESLQRLGFNAFFQAQFQSLQSAGQIPEGAVVARVVSEARGRFVTSNGEGTRSAVLAGRLEHAGLSACVGDFVLLERDAVDTLSRISHIFARSSLFQRKAPGPSSQPQPIAANIDLAIVVCALAPGDADPHAQTHGLNPRRIERYLRAIRDAPARACVALNKADLTPFAAAHAAQLQAELRAVQVVPVSAERGEGLLALSSLLLPASTAVLVGSSGVGKSSLTNRLLGREIQSVSSVREHDTRGRHTTTGRELFVLPSGALLIDTPGMREFGLFAEHDSESEGTGFPEIDELAPACRFRDCRHSNEPGCAVLAAVAAGSVAGERLDQAHRLERELSWQRKRHDPLRASELRSAWRAQSRASRADPARRGKR